MHKYPDVNSDRDAIIKTIKSFNSNLNDNDAWDIYTNTLKDENGVFISELDNDEDIFNWFLRLKKRGNLKTDINDFISKFESEYLNTDCYNELIEYIYSIKDRCMIGIFSDLIKPSYAALNKQLRLNKFDYVWLSYLLHLRKTSSKAFEKVEEELSIMPSNILLIDDTSINIENAKKRGWNICQACGYEFDMIKNAIEKFLSK